MSAATRADSRCIWPRCAGQSRASMPRALRSKWRSGILRRIATLSRERGLGRGRRVRDPARLVGGGRDVRHDRARSAGVCEDQARGRRRAARLQGAEPAGSEDAAAGRVCWSRARAAIMWVGRTWRARWPPLLPMRTGAYGCWSGEGQRSDHPVVLNLPETEYLKCLVLEVE